MGVSKMTVVQEVVEKGWCIGCGMCAALCPKSRLVMRWNVHGEYNPIMDAEATSCRTSCSVCYGACPAHGDNDNETRIAEALYASLPNVQCTDETGYFLASFGGYSTEHRLKGASGGMATWTLEKLLSTGRVDAVIAVGPTRNPEAMFDFRVCRTVKEVGACSRSAYYPVEISETIRHVLNNPGRYAVIALPCVCKAIRLAQQKNKVLKDRVRFVLGLTCGHQSSKFFAEYICALTGNDPSHLNQIFFRTKDLSQPASNSQFQCHVENNGSVSTHSILWNQGVGDAFSKGYFQIPGCFYCDDVFAECADAAFMDAWLPEYVPDSKGTSLLIVRDREIEEMLSFCETLYPVPIGRVIASQQSVIAWKRRRCSDTCIPRIRCELHARFSPGISLIVKARQKIAIQSRGLWVNCNRDIHRFQKAMISSHQSLSKLIRLAQIAALPWRFVKGIVQFFHLRK